MKEFIGEVELDYTYFDDNDIYNEGDEVEEKVLDTVKKSTDYSEHLKVLAEDNRWPILYQLSKQRENIIEPMDINLADEVLEIGAGMGAVTGAIARRAKSVDCIELSKRRSLANAYRNRNYNNIKIYVGNFQNIKIKKKYDVVTLIGVLEYAQHYINDSKPYDMFLKKILEYLKPNGRIYIAIENKLGLKYFAGCAEDHIGMPFVGLEGYCKGDKVRTFSKSQLENLLLNNGYKNIYFYYPHPDYKLPSEIFSDDYLPTPDNRLINVPNYDLDRMKLFDEEKVFNSLKDAEEIKMLFNSYLVEAIKEEI